ncbi:PEP/pyruvate-binding domain-containing protein [Roseateles koreensis]|uniref:PEP/pyruvate-binding domain-containing protein n=1 Tax=Roseateles koreensis TaxID=2987526 RepID=A0ABT5KP34_9BURK|nr:PEP/pyruvate-binding domain-containing protein [Roseateles koreensis]MDC8784680.1 PEP/pyruvate-binding domain-containing protein [Roseateles koreensis]
MSALKALSIEAALPNAVYLIGCGTEDVGAGQHGEDFVQACASSMGFKAWNLLRMARLALPVPPAFVLGTRYCVDPAARAQAAGAGLSGTGLWQAGLQALERSTGLRLGDARRPLLLSVRSGAPVSMPGMMETLLNIGLCDATVGGLLRQTGNPRLVWDAYRRLIASYGEVVAGLPAQCFEAATEALCAGRDERALDFAELRTLTQRFLELYAQQAGQPFPQQPATQLAGAIEAVFASWQSTKACEYRRLNHIADDIGTAVTVQRMVFGNAGGQSGAGVGFTRDPASGEAALWVDFLFNAQGEDVVSGRRSANGHDELAAVLPEVWQALKDAAHQLEQAMGDMQDFEFTVEQGQLFMLQTRSGKRTPRATARIALDLFDEGVIAQPLAQQRTAGLDRQALACPCVRNTASVPLVPLGRAASASSGVAIGEIALDAVRAQARHAAGVAVVLVRRDAETGDFTALESSVGLLTQRGARTSHAAVVARQLGKVCLVGCSELQIDEAARTVTVGDALLHEGDLLTLDGNEGVFYAGEAQVELEYPQDLLARLDALRQLSAPC